MKLGMTLLCRDEGDIIEAWLNHHLPYFDHLVITDNGSVDGTREILEGFKDAVNGQIKGKYVEIIDEPEIGYQQNKWVERMMDKCKDVGCKWVVNSDADEFWQCDFKQLIEKNMDMNSIAVRCRLYVPTAKDDKAIKSPIERMKYYTTTGRNIHEAECLRCWHKLIINMDRFDSIEIGNHMAFFKGSKKNVVADVGNRIDHYPFRSWEQYRSKVINGGEAYLLSKLSKEYGNHWRRRYDHYYKDNIVGLKKLWYSEELEYNLKQLQKD